MRSYNWPATVRPSASRNHCRIRARAGSYGHCPCDRGLFRQSERPLNFDPAGRLRLRRRPHRAVYISLQDVLKFARGRSLLPPHRKPPVMGLIFASPGYYNCVVMSLYATLPCPASCPPFPLFPEYSPQARRGRLSAWPLLSPVLWRHSIPETLKTDIQNEAANLLKTNGRSSDFSRWRSQ